MKTLILLLTIQLISAFGWAETKHELCKASEPIQESQLNPKAIEEYAKKNKLTHPHDVICCLPESMRKNYVIVTESFSAQGGAEEFKTKDGKIDPKKMAPRVILFSEGPSDQPVDLSISFNGLPEQRNHMNLEMMTFEKKPSDQNHHGFVDIDFSDGLKRSEKNPNKCLACHGRTLGEESEFKKARPRWDSNPFWPRTFGSDPTRNAPPHLTQFEQENKEAFKNLAPTVPGYQCLVDLQGKLTRPFGMTNMNTEYSLRIAAGNRYRVSSLLRESKDYDKYKYAILGSLMGCHSKTSSIAEFLPPEVRKHHDNQDHLIQELREKPLNKETFDEIQKAAKDFMRLPEAFTAAATQIEQNVGEPISRYMIDNFARQGFWQMDPSKSIASLRWLMEGRDIYMGDYSIDITEGGYRFNNSIRSGRNESVYLAERLMLDDPDLANQNFSKELFGYIDKTRKVDAPGIIRNPNETVSFISQEERGPANACEQLKQKSLTAFGAKPSPAIQERSIQFPLGGER
jgi:hypothetical protein